MNKYQGRVIRALHALQENGELCENCLLYPIDYEEAYSKEDIDNFFEQLRESIEELEVACKLYREVE